MHRVLFICLGNICRSPTAEGVFRNLVLQSNLAEKILVDSAGIGGWHTGSPPDARAQEAAFSRGIDLSPLRARRVAEEDIKAFDLIIAMDRNNLKDLKDLAGSKYQHKIYLLLDFAFNVKEEEVPDPYYGGEEGFDNVLNMIETASKGLLDHIQSS